MDIRKIAVVGLGYIGLPTAAILASREISVVGIDVNESVVDTINRGGIHIIEPDLEVVVRGAVNSGYLRAYTEPQQADAFLIAVPTPFCEDHRPDLSYIESAARSVARVLEPGNLVVLESTSPVGATEYMAKCMAQERTDLSFPHQAGEESDIRIAHCPERVMPGQVLRELVDNARVIGGATPRCAFEAAAVYRTFVRSELIHTDVRTAEMCKLTENAFRDVNIAFANEVSLLCDRYGIDVWKLIELANRHPRVNILQPGIGVGGHCIAVDPWFLISNSSDVARVMRSAREVNDGMPEFVFSRIASEIRESGCGTVACLGLAFKPNVDDVRESPAVRIVRKLAEANEGVDVLAVEPHIGKLPDGLRLENVALTTLEDAMERADVLIALVRHDAFREVKAVAKHGQKKLMDFVNLPA